MRGRVISLSLAAALVLAVLTGCAAKSKPAVTLIIKVPPYRLESVVDDTVPDMFTLCQRAGEDFAAQYDRADVTVQVVQIDSARRVEEVEGAFDTPNAADLTWGDSFSYLYTGRVVPLDDVITDDLRDDIDDDVWQSCQVQGKTYSMPFCVAQVVLCYNRALFAQAGLSDYLTDDDVIQSWTLEEWDEVLSTLRRNLPEDVYPMMMYAADEQGDMHIMTLLRSHGADFYAADGSFDLTDPACLAAMEWLRACNEKGYFPPHPETLAMLDNYALFTNGQLAIYVANVAIESLYHQAGWEFGRDYGMVNLPSQDGRGYNTSTVEGFQLFDNGDPDKLQTGKDFLRFFYAGDYLNYSAGLIPVSHRVTKAYEGHLGDTEKYVKNTAMKNNYTGNHPNWNGVRAVFYRHIQDLLYGEKPVATVAQELQDACNAAVRIGYDQSCLHP